MKAYHIYINKAISSQIGVFGEPEGISASYIADELKQAKAQGAEKIVLHINSPGGEVYEGFSIFNQITATGLPVESYIEGLSASIATLIMLSGGEKNSIIMSPTSQLMFHKPSGQTHGTIEEHKNSVENLQQIEDLMAERYAAKMGKDISAGYELMSKGDYFVKPQDAKNLGIIDLVQMPIAAFAKNQIKSNKNMKKNNVVSKFLMELAEMIDPTPGTPMNGMIRLADGQTIVHFEGDSLTTGKAVYKDESMTEAFFPGEHELEDGRIMVVDDAGICVELRENVLPDNSEALAQAQARIAELEQENASLKAEKQSLITNHNTKLASILAKVKSANLGDIAEVIEKPEDKKRSPFVQKTIDRVKAAHNGRLTA